MSKVTRIISVSMMLTVLSAIILVGCGNRHSDKTGLNKSDITESLSQTSESEKGSQILDKQPVKRTVRKKQAIHI